MKPSLYTLQHSFDGVIFTTLKDFKTNVDITFTSLDTATQYIYRYRMLGAKYYFRIKGSAPGATSIYSNIITIDSDSDNVDVPALTGVNKIGYGIRGRRIAGSATPTNEFTRSYLYKEGDERFRHCAVHSIPLNSGLSTILGADSQVKSTNGKLYFGNDQFSSVIKLRDSIGEFDPTTETFNILYTGAPNSSYASCYHKATNTIYYVMINGIWKYNLSTFVGTNVTPLGWVNFSTAVRGFIEGDKMYYIVQKSNATNYEKSIHIFDIPSGTLNIVLMPTSFVNNKTVVGMIYNDFTKKVYIPSVNQTDVYHYDTITGTTGVTTSNSFGWLDNHCLSPNGQNVIFGGQSKYGYLNTTTNVITTFPAVGFNEVACKLLENGKVLITNRSGANGVKPIIFDTGETLTIDPLHERNNR
jgi:hypothetical protein